MMFYQVRATPSHYAKFSKSSGGAELWGFSAAGLIAGLITGLIKEEKAGKSGRALWPCILLRLANLGETPSPPQNKGAANSTQPKNPALPEAPGGAVSGRRGRRPSAALLSACRPTSLPHPHTSRQGLTFGGFFIC